MDADEMGRLYSEYYPRSSFSEEGWRPYDWEPCFTSWIAGRASAYMYVPPKVRILDIGCGFGGALGYHSARGCDAHGTEMDANAQRIAAAHKLDIRQGAFDPAEWESASFDYVTLDQVLEHNYEPLPLLRDIGTVLKHEGVLLLTTPNAGSLAAKLLGRHWIHLHPPYHVLLYTRVALRHVLDKAGFRIIWMKTVSPSEWTRYQFIHCCLSNIEGEKSPFWDPRSTRHYSRKEGRLLRLADLLHRCHTFAVATRLIDACGLGDNLIVWAKKKI